MDGWADLPTDEQLDELLAELIRPYPTASRPVASRGADSVSPLRLETRRSILATPPVRQSQEAASSTTSTESSRAAPVALRRSSRPTPVRPPSSRSTPQWRTKRPMSVGTWATREHTNDGLVPFDRLPDDALEYVLSFLWPPRVLGPTRMASQRLLRAVESLNVECHSCTGPVGWRMVLFCDGCQDVGCRKCAGIELKPPVERCFVGRIQCSSCGGLVQKEWINCPWCGTIRPTGVKKKFRSRRRTASGSWVVHSCGPEMVPRRMCQSCTQTCALCSCAGCRDCVWSDANRKMCYGCTVLYAR